jgi:MFS family permease
MAGSAYIELLRKRQVQVVVGAVIVAGINVGAPLAIVLMVQHETGSFASAGAVTAAIAIAGALSSPYQGRLIDRYGQTRTLPPFALLGAVGTVALVIATLGGASVAVLVAIGFVTGLAAASIMPALRPLWADLVDHPGQLGTAYAIHAMLTEVFFIAGPLIAGALIALGSPAAAVLAIAAARLAGVLALIATPASRAWRGEERKVGRAGALASPGMRTMLAADVPFGAMFGFLDVAVPAFAKGEGSAASAGVVLAALAVGSMIGGGLYGAGERPVTPSRYALLAAGQAVLTLPLVLAGSIGQLAVAMAIAGLLVAPLTIVGFATLDRVAPAGTAAEATSWVLTAYMIGLAGGTAVAGALVDGAGTTAAFACAVGLAALSAAVLWARRRTLGP